MGSVVFWWASYKLVDVTSGESRPQSFSMRLRFVLTLQSLLNKVLSKLCKVSTNPGLCQNWNKLLNTNKPHTSSLLSIHIHELLLTIEGEPSCYIFYTAIHLQYNYYYLFLYHYLILLTFNFQNVKWHYIYNYTTSIIRLLSPPQNHRSINARTSNARSRVELKLNAHPPTMITRDYSRVNTSYKHALHVS